MSDHSLSTKSDQSHYSFFNYTTHTSLHSVSEVPINPCCSSQ